MVQRKEKQLAESEQITTQAAKVKASNRRVFLTLGMVAVLMFGFAFALVPLYRIICDVTGVNSVATNTTRVKASDVVDMVVDRSRLITIEFDATINGNLPWEFKPNIKKVQVHPGERKQVSYYFKNNADHPVTTQSVPGVTPWQASRHFQKIECFCFNTQTLAAGEEVEMGLLFVVDAELPKEINTLTLSYTIMDIDRGKALEKPDLSATDNDFAGQPARRISMR
jgi:cytochrome c oxidase assembly protein subunit 11